MSNPADEKANTLRNPTTDKSKTAKQNNSPLLQRHFTSPGQDPYDQIDWEYRTALIGSDDNPVFKQENVEVPSFWSQNATNIVAQKYFAYGLDDPRRENSARELIDRVVDKITKEGINNNYFTKEESKIFSDELKYILIHQLAAFNSPVWFNIGVQGAKQQASACFILSVYDSIDSISRWYSEEAKIFQGGSGSGLNLSNLRASGEGLSRGGEAAGPVTFMRAADASAGTLQSAGRTRRAAKLVCLDADHPDIEDFIWCKAREEDRIHALAAAGFDMSINTDAGEKNRAEATAYQNANNSVRVSDEFMRAAENDEDWQLIGRRDGQAIKTVKAKKLLREIAEAAHKCADPGLQYSTTINDWHTTPAQGAITASNPCFPGDARVLTEEGEMRFIDLYQRYQAGDCPRVYTHEATAEQPGFDLASSYPLEVMQTGVQKINKLLFNDGTHLRCTPNHRLWTTNRGYVPAEELSADDNILTADNNTVRLTRIADNGQEATYNLSEPLHQSYIVNNIVVANCSEYMSNDNSACNLASLNVLKFLKSDAQYDIAAFQQTARIIFLAQEITIAFADFPTTKIAKNTKALRQIGMGYSNLGALLMALGLPYDSDEGRDYAAALTALLTGEGYKMSAEIARKIGPFDYYQENREPMLAVLDKHVAASRKLSGSSEAVKQLNKQAKKTWQQVVQQAAEHGVRNAQASVAAPTGTISFLMDCDTTGIEPDFALVKHKNLVGGGTMTIVNRTVALALKNLGYSQDEVKDILAYIEEDIDRGNGYRGPRGNIIDAPHLKEEHYPVFDCAVGKRFIAPMGHVKMMGATQPFLSGSISKTINVPQDSSVEDIAEVYLKAWKQGLKSLAIYRDGSKAGQPLDEKEDRDEEALQAAENRLTSLLGDGLLRGERRKVPRDAQVVGVNFNIGTVGGYVHCRLFEDGTPGAIFVDVGQAGSTLHGFIHAWAVTMSLGFQYGLPLDMLVSKLAWAQFEPSGMTDDPQIKTARSIVDYVTRWLATQFLELDPISRQQLGLLSTDDQENTQAQPDSPLSGDISPAPEVHAPIKAATKHEGDKPQLTASATDVCSQCGGVLIRTGTCMACTVCGDTSGCG